MAGRPHHLHALLLGALISPTDPIAVLGIIKKAGAPRELETRITGESLFNDRVGVVIFMTVLGVASGQSEPNAARVSWFFVEEAFGGIALGWLLDWIVFRMLRQVNNYQVETMLSLALCLATYALAEAVHVSAPIAVVVAGLLLGNQGRELAMSEQTQEYLDMSMVDARISMLTESKMTYLPGYGLPRQYTAMNIKSFVAGFRSSGWPQARRY